MEILMNYDWPGNVRELRNITTYLLTLSKLPEYILEQKSQSGKSFDFKADTVSDMILQIIYANTTLSHGVGRPLLIQELGQQGYSISDVKLRKILKQLQSDELIQIAKGRGGTRITKKRRRTSSASPKRLNPFRPKIFRRVKAFFTIIPCFPKIQYRYILCGRYRYFLYIYIYRILIVLRTFGIISVA